jgi:copper(I)-binding protein
MIRRRFLLVLSFAAASLIALQPSSAAADDGLQVKAACERATAGAAKNGVAYLTLVNPGSQAARLLAASSEVAKHSGLHTHIMQDGAMMMRPVEAIEVPAGGQVVLKPGGLHVMLMGLVAPLQEGERFALTLAFERAAPLSVEVEVMGVGAMGPDAGQDAGHSQDMHQEMDQQMDHEMPQDDNQ